MRRSALVGLALVVVSAGPPAHSASNPEVAAPAFLADCNLEGSDEHAQVVTDGSGMALAVWHSTASLDDTIGTDRDILFSRSWDNGATWTARAPLNANAATDTMKDEVPQVATDGVGHWVAVWQSGPSPGTGGDKDILVARSTDNGATWTLPVYLNAGAAGDTAEDGSPQIATDGAGHWVAVWESNNSLGGTIGTDTDILVARSSDQGATWTVPAPLNTTAFADDAVDKDVRLAADGAGTWLAVWQIYDSSGGPYGADTDLLMARSVDGGITWSDAAPLNNAATDGDISDGYPQLTTDGAGHWVAVWESIDGHTSTGDDWNILVARSDDSGATWTTPEILNTDAAIDVKNDHTPSVTTDGRGLWLSVWRASELYNDDHDIYMAVSRDHGVTWTAPSELNTNAPTDTAYDWNPQVATSAAGRWVAVWHAQGGGTPADILVARLIFCDLDLEGSAPTMVRFPSPSSMVAGTLSALRESASFADATCLGDFASTAVPLPLEDPPSGDGWYVLARGNPHCASYGDSSLVPDPRDDLDQTDPCP